MVLLEGTTLIAAHAASKAMSSAPQSLAQWLCDDVDSCGDHLTLTIAEEYGYRRRWTCRIERTDPGWLALRIERAEREWDGTRLASPAVADAGARWLDHGLSGCTLLIHSRVVPRVGSGVDGEADGGEMLRVVVRLAGRAGSAAVAADVARHEGELLAHALARLAEQAPVPRTSAMEFEHVVALPVSVDAPAVWRTLAHHEAQRRWLPGGCMSLRPGGAWTLRLDDDHVARGRVLVAIPPRRLLASIHVDTPSVVAIADCPLDTGEPVAMLELRLARTSDVDRVVLTTHLDAVAGDMPTGSAPLLLNALASGFARVADLLVERPW